MLYIYFFPWNWFTQNNLPAFSCYIYIFSSWNRFTQNNQLAFSCYIYFFPEIDLHKTTCRHSLTMNLTCDDLATMITNIYPLSPGSGYYLWGCLGASCWEQCDMSILFQFLSWQVLTWVMNPIAMCQVPE